MSVELLPTPFVLRRREVLALLAGAALPASRSAKAQTTPAKRIAFLPDLNSAWGDPVISHLRDLGWIEGRTFSAVPSGVELGAQQIGEGLKRVLDAKPDVVFT